MNSRRRQRCRWKTATADRKQRLATQLYPASRPHLPRTFTRVKQIPTTAAGCNSRSFSLLLKPVCIHFIWQPFMRCCDASLVCVENDVTAGLPANYNTTTNKLDEPNLTSIGCFSRKKKSLKWFLRFYWFCFGQNPNVYFSTTSLLLHFVFVLSLFFPRQSDHHVLRQIKGGPSGQKAIKMTCCERMQSGMWHTFIDICFAAVHFPVGKKSKFQSSFYRAEQCPALQF